MSFLKRGAAAHEALARAEAETEARKAASSGVHRFYLRDDEEKRITFLDGGLTQDNLLDHVNFNEHQVQLNGSWLNWFPCTEDVDLTQPCPICEQGDGYRKSLVHAFTIIDHSEWKDKSGKIHKHEKKLYMCKRGGFKVLQNLATKRGGLTGVTFDVMRCGDNGWAAGNQFDFIEKNNIADIAAKYGLEDVAPYDYDEVFTYRPPEELIALGFGLGTSTPSAVANTKVDPPTKVYDKDL